MAANKYLGLVTGVITNTSAIQTGGAGNAGKIVALNDTTGLLDASMMPVGVGADTVTLTVGTTTIADGDMVYITSAGLVELAQANVIGTIAQGFCSVGNTTGNPVTVNLNGSNIGVSGLTPGVEHYLSAATAGKITSTPPTTGYVQPVGFAVTATRLSFNRQRVVAA